MTVLDFCAGGGGKALALAAAMGGRGRLMVHDANVARMKDLPARARRAGARVEILTPEERLRGGAALRPRVRRRALLGHGGVAADAGGQVAARRR
jgi:hypothetical protein